MRGVVKEGYELKTYSNTRDYTTDPALHAYTQVYLLQKGDSVIRCEEAEWYENGKQTQAAFNCYQLVKPY